MCVCFFFNRFYGTTVGAWCTRIKKCTQETFGVKAGYISNSPGYHTMVLGSGKNFNFPVELGCFLAAVFGIPQVSTSCLVKPCCPLVYQGTWETLGLWLAAT